MLKTQNAHTAAARKRLHALTRAENTAYAHSGSIQEAACAHLLTRAEDTERTQSGSMQRQQGSRAQQTARTCSYFCNCTDLGRDSISSRISLRQQKNGSNHITGSALKSWIRWPWQPSGRGKPQIVHWCHIQVPLLSLGREERPPGKFPWISAHCASSDGSCGLGNLPVDELLVQQAMHP